MFCAGCCGVSTLGATNVCWCVSFSFFSGGAIDALSAHEGSRFDRESERGAIAKNVNLENNFEARFGNFTAPPPPSSVQCLAALMHAKPHFPRPRMQSNVS